MNTTWHKWLTLGAMIASAALTILSVSLGVELVIGAGDRLGHVFLGFFMAAWAFCKRFGGS